MRLLIAIPIVAALAVVGVLVVRGSDTGDFPDIRAPANVTTTLPPPPTAPVDLTVIQLPGVDGTTTTAPIRSTGTAHLAGLVKGPGGPVAGATVRLEHLADPVVTTDVVAGPDGHYDASNIAGGRYRVRAFLAPTLAQTDPEVFFLADSELRGLDLSVRAYGGLVVTSATAPDPPLRGDPASFVVRVAARAVDSGGIVRVRPVPNATVQLVGAVGWIATGSSTALTDGSGDASFTLLCIAAGADQVQAQVQVAAADAPQPVSLTTPTCIDRPPPPPPTTAAPPSSAPPASAPN